VTDRAADLQGFSEEPADRPHTRPHACHTGSELERRESRDLGLFALLAPSGSGPSAHADRRPRLPDRSKSCALRSPIRYRDTSGGIGLAKSRDGGLTWTSSMLPDVSAYAFEPAIAVNKDGTVGVIWYDLRNDRPGDAALTADLWFAHSHNRGSSWRQTHVAGPTDLQPYPFPAASTMWASTRGSRDSVTASRPTSRCRRRKRRTAPRTSSSLGSSRAAGTPAIPTASEVEREPRGFPPRLRSNGTKLDGPFDSGWSWQ
jgi:hypothetical protein